MECIYKDLNLQVDPFFDKKPKNHLKIQFFSKTKIPKKGKIRKKEVNEIEQKGLKQ